MIHGRPNKRLKLAVCPGAALAAGGDQDWAPYQGNGRARTARNLAGIRYADMGEELPGNAGDECFG